MRSCARGREHMPREVPDPSDSLQYSPPPRWNIPAIPTRLLPLPVIYATASSPLSSLLRHERPRRARLHKRVGVAKQKAAALLSIPPGGGGNGDWREGDQGGPGGGAAAA